MFASIQVQPHYIIGISSVQIRCWERVFPQWCKKIIKEVAMIENIFEISKQLVYRLFESARSMN